MWSGKRGLPLLKELFLQLPAQAAVLQLQSCYIFTNTSLWYFHQQFLAQCSSSTNNFFDLHQTLVLNHQCCHHESMTNTHFSQLSISFLFYLVVSNILYFHPYLGRMIQSEEHIFQQGGHHQLVLFASSFPSVLQQVFNHFPPFQLRNHRNGIKKTRRRGNSELGTREELKLDKKTDLWWKNSGYMMATVYIYTYVCVCVWICKIY